MCQRAIVIPPSFGDRIRLLREQAPRLTQRELDLLAGLHVGHTWQIEEGHRENPTRQTAVALSEVFRVSLDWLLVGRGVLPSRLDVIAAVNDARMRCEVGHAAGAPQACKASPDLSQASAIFEKCHE